MKKIQIIGFFAILLFFPNIVKAKQVKYLFYGIKFVRLEKSHGKIEGKTFCENTIDLTKYNIDVNGTVGQNADDIYVSPNEKYFVFHGAVSPQAPWRYFLVDLANCKIIKELKSASGSEVYFAAFSPDSKKLYIKWIIASSFPGAVVEKEFTGNGFANEKILKNMPSLLRFENSAGPYRRFWFYSYKFSRDGNILLTDYFRPQRMDIYDVSQDRITASFPDSRVLFPNKKPYPEEFHPEAYMPEITKGFLLFNFKTPTGTEMDIFNYNTKKVVGKIINAQKGLGSFSGDGKKIIFAEFPNTTTWKRNVIVYDKATGSVLGQAVLDEQDDIVDVSSDNTKLIYKRNGVQKTISIR